MLCELSQTGTADDVRQFLKTSSPVPEEDLNESLAIAASRGDCELVKLLLDHRALPNRYPRSHWPPLHCAIEEQNAELVKLLCSHGADINFATDSGLTPLHLAVDIDSDVASQQGSFV